MAKKKKGKTIKKKAAALKTKKRAAAKKKAPKQKTKKTSAKVKKTPAKKRVSAPAAAPMSYRPAANESKLGEVEDFFSRIGVIALTLKVALATGDTIHVRGHTTDFTIQVDSMQIEHAPVQSAKPGDSVGIKVSEKCRKGDDVFKVR